MSRDGVSQYTHDAPPWMDGYDRMQYVRKAAGWVITPSWGRDGWDLGNWPLVSVMLRERFGKYWVRYDVEGDVKISEFDTEAEQIAYVDELAFFHWKWAEEPWVKDIAVAGDMPDYLRGPCTAERLRERLEETIA